MANLNHQNEDGDTPLHYGLKVKTSYEIFEYLVQAGADVNIRNYSGESVFHLAAKFSDSLLQATDLLLQYGANVNEIDNSGSSVLHRAFQNPSVSLEVIEKLLKTGAFPDYRDEFGCPPLAYCHSSTLPPDQKLSAERMLILYSVIKKLYLNLQDFLDSEENRDTIVCFHFSKDEEKLQEWVGFRDSCITELLDIGKVQLGSGYTLLNFLFDYSCNLDKSLDVSSLKAILCLLQKRKCSVFREMLISSIEKYDFKDLIEELFSLDFVALSSRGMVKMSLQCIYKLFQFLPKKDLINFILAFYNF